MRAAVALFTTMSRRPYASSACCTISAAPSHVAEVVSATACPPGGDDLVDDTGGVGSGAQPDVVHDDRRAFGREELGVLAPDPAAGAGDDRDLPVQTSTHGAGGYGSGAGRPHGLTSRHDPPG